MHPLISELRQHSMVKIKKVLLINGGRRAPHDTRVVISVASFNPVPSLGTAVTTRLDSS